MQEKKKQVSIKLEDFKKVKYLGRGSFGEVHLVRNIESKENLAMKEIDKKQLVQYILIKILLEKEILRLCNHPFIIKLNKSFQDGENVYFILEYCHGGSLQDFINSRGSIVQALQYLHQNGIIHRDLKPENIMLDIENKIKIIDFGTAGLLNENLIPQDIQDQIQKQRSKDSNIEQKQVFVGTAEQYFNDKRYVSPEMLENQICGPASDIWALGCIIYKLFTGITPFYDQTEFLIFEKIKKLDFKLSNKIPKDAQDLIKQILILNPNDRIIKDQNYEKLLKHSFFKGIDFQNFNNNRVPLERKIILNGIQRKKCGFILYKPRKLILYDNKVLEYHDPQKNILKGTIDLKNVVQTKLINQDKWHIQIPSRVYKFKVKYKNQKSYENEISPQKWIEKIKLIINTNKN